MSKDRTSRTAPVVSPDGRRWRWDGDQWAPAGPGDDDVRPAGRDVPSRRPTTRSSVPLLGIVICTLATLVVLLVVMLVARTFTSIGASIPHDDQPDPAPTCALLDPDC